MTDPVWVEQYRLVSRLGAGATADVFLAQAPAADPVMLKVFHPAERSFEMCQREFRLSSAAHTVYTPTILGYGMAAAGAYIVSAYLPGYDCATTLNGRLIGAHQLRRFATGLPHALAAIHARDVVHCDVKPANLLVRGGDVRLIDFGIARYAGQDCQSDVFVECSRGWAAPEQLSTAPPTPAMDVFAWGCVLAFFAGGVHPFTSHDDHEWIMRVQAANPTFAVYRPSWRTSSSRRWHGIPGSGRARVTSSRYAHHRCDVRTGVRGCDLGTRLCDQRRTNLASKLADTW